MRGGEKMFSSKFIDAVRDELIAVINNALTGDDEFLVKVGDFVAEIREGDADQEATEKLTELIRLSLTED